MENLFVNAFSGFSIFDGIDIAIVAFIVYKLLVLVMETRAAQIIKGLLIFFAVMLASDALNLYTLNWLCKGAVALGAVAILIVLQPELRRVLEFLGRSRIFRTGQSEKDKSKKIVTQIVRAVDTFSEDRVGALIVFENDTVLEDIAETGTIINADVTEALLGTIFYEGTPLHDGATIISNGKIYAGGCVLPLTKNIDIGKNLGTRHRAGLGITENSDALVIIVSEESGIISVARDGKMDRFLSIRELEKTLLDFYLEDGYAPTENKSEIPFIGRFFGRGKKDDNAKAVNKDKEDQDA